MLSRQGGGFGAGTMDGAGSYADPLLILEIGQNSGPVTILGFRSFRSNDGRPDVSTTRGYRRARRERSIVD